MARQKQSTEPTEDQLKVNTARLQTLAKAAADIAQAKQWRARKSGGRLQRSVTSVPMWRPEPKPKRPCIG
jgi:hypothetical protein